MPDQIKSLKICFIADVIITEETTETAIISMSHNFAEGLRFFKNFKTAFEIKAYERRNTKVLKSIIKKSFIIFAVKTPAALYSSHDSESKTSLSPSSKIVSAKQWS